MGAEGFWEDSERAAAVVGRARARVAAPGGLSRRSSPTSRTSTRSPSWPPRTRRSQAEVDEQIASVERRLGELEEQRLFSGPYDAGDALVTVNAGAGGTDAQDWAEMVLRMLMRWAERRGFEVELLEVSPGEEAGIKSATFRVAGENAYGLLGAERGVHRLVRLSPFDSAHRRQTSFAGVEVAPVVEDAGEVEIDEDDLQVDTYRASGAGGQHVNKTDSAVRITHRPTGIVVQCQNERSQSSNRATAMAMLRAKLLERQERERQEEIAREKGEAQDVNFGSQIRSYVLHPYTMVKDHRTGDEMGDVQRVLDGDLDGFVRAYLLARPKRTASDGRPAAAAADTGAPALVVRARWPRTSASGDVTTRGDRARAGARARASIVQKAPGVIYGLAAAERAFTLLDEDAARRAARRGGCLARAWGRGPRGQRERPRAAHRRAHRAELPRPPLGHRHDGSARGRAR